MPPKGGKSKLGYNPAEAFSGQKKKAILRGKREKGRQKDESDSEGGSDEEGWGAAISAKLALREEKEKPVMVTSFGASSEAEGSRLSSLFTREDKEAVAARRTRGEEPLCESADQKGLVAEEWVPFQIPSSDSQSSMGLKLPHPVRPTWHEKMSAAELAKQEEAYFTQWCDETFARTESLGSDAADVAPFELNLEVWRQLWRVVEQSDVVVLIVDVRNPTFHIPPSLVHDITVTQSRRLVIALSKCDLVPQAFVRRWQRYLTSKLPSVGVVEFMSRPVDDPPGGERGAGGISMRRRWLTKRYQQSEIDDHLYIMAQTLMLSILDKEAGEVVFKAVSSETTAKPARLNKREAAAARRDEALLEELKAAKGGKANTAHEVGAEAEAQVVGVGRGPGGALAIGLVGHPNVGKTSVLNALAGRKAASVSGTAGHTRHLQHIRCDENVHANAYVIDCPGLVFPSLNPRAQAELNGLLPLAQVRETMTGVRIIAEAWPIVKSLALKMPDWYENEEDQQPWTPLAIVEAYAEKHKYHIPRSGAPDIHRAGLEILKDTKDGAILLAYEPPS